MTNPGHTLSRALSALLERPSWQSLNFAKLRELCIAQSGGRQGNYIVKLFLLLASLLHRAVWFAAW